MDRLDAMRVFATVVDTGSLSAAGRALSVPLATVSRKLADLEAHLKTRLLVRSTRRLELTDAGRDYLASCREILERVDEAERVASGAYSNPRGELVIAAPVVFGRMHAVPTIGEFLAKYPDINVRLQLGDRYVNLIEEHVDVALRVGHLADSGLVATQLGLIQRVVCASPRYLDKWGTPRTPDDLARHDAVNFEGLMSSTAWVFNSPGGPTAVPVRARLSVTTADAAILAAIEGVGLTSVLSYQVADALADGRLIRLLSEYELPALPLSLVYSGQRRMPMKSRAFIDFAVPRMRERLRTGRDILA